MQVLSSELLSEVFLGFRLCVCFFSAEVDKKAGSKPSLELSRQIYIIYLFDNLKYLNIKNPTDNIKVPHRNRIIHIPSSFVYTARYKAELIVRKNSFITSK